MMTDATPTTPTPIPPKHLPARTDWTPWTQHPAAPHVWATTYCCGPYTIVGFIGVDDPWYHVWDRDQGRALAATGYSDATYAMSYVERLTRRARKAPVDEWT